MSARTLHSPRIDPSTVQASAGAASCHVSHLNNHANTQGKPCRAAPWTFETTGSRRRATSYDSRTDPITFQHPEEGSCEDRGAWRITGSAERASTPGFRRAPSAGPRFSCTAGTWSPGFGGDSTPRTPQSAEEVSAMRAAMKIHSFPCSVNIMGITGAEDLRSVSKQYVKSDLPLSDTATRQMDRRMMLSSFAGCRRRGGNQQIAESPDMFHCMHYPSGVTAHAGAHTGARDGRAERNNKAGRPVKDPLRNYRDAEPATPSVASSRGSATARSRP